MLRPIVGAMALVLSAACAPVQGGPDGSDATEVLGTAYETLADRYIEPVDVRTLTIDGLRGLSRIDPDFVVEATKDRITLLRGGRVAASEAAPAADDPAAWAQLAAHTLEQAEATSSAARNSGRERVYAAMLRGALSSLDRYTRYTTAEAARRARASRHGFGGLGVSIRTEDGATRIMRIHDDTPAARAGLKVGDVITHADGTPLAGLDQSEVVAALRGPVGSSVELTLARAGTPAPIQLSLTRSRIVIPTVVAERTGDFLVLHVSGFNQGTTDAVRRALSRGTATSGKRIRGVVLDLRDNPGGLLDQAVRLSDVFLTEGRIAATIGRHPKSLQVFDAHRRDYADGAPLVVLINGRSASSSEIVAAALRDGGRAVVLGSSSYGKGTVQTIVGLPNGGELILTWASLRSPAGLPLNELGVAPTVCTARGGSAASVLAALRENSVPPLSAAPIEAAEAARRECPPRDGESALDLEVAKRLLGDPSLYRAALARHPSIAEHPSP